MELSSLIQSSFSRYAKRDAVVCGETHWNYQELQTAIEKLCGGFHKFALHPQDRVAILHRNCHRFFQAALASALNDLILVPLNLRLDAQMLGEMLNDCGAKLLLVEEKTAALAHEAVSKSGLKIPIVSIAECESGSHSAHPHSAGEHIAQIYYTSGTTGKPRGVMLLHRNIASHAQMTIEELELSDRDVWAHIAPMFHLADAWSVFAITQAGGKHVFFPEFETEEILNGFVQEKITITNLVPTMLNRLVAEESAAQRRYPALRAVLSGGAPIAPALVKKIMETFRTQYIQTYGLTETSPYLTFSLLHESMQKLGEEEKLRIRSRTGRAAKGVELRVVDDKGTEIAKDDCVVGEIWVKAPWVTPGYWNRPQESAAAFHEGWFKTGDLATWDSAGYVNIVDRKKDMIITGGEKVFSVEVECALAAHPAVFECAVVGLPDPDWGEAVTAAIVFRPKQSEKADTLRDFLKTRLASFKIPKRFHFLEQLPKTGSGKIQKNQIRSLLK